jgi:pimeloyl-ACP methyl ester carboxylesterase
MTYIRRIEKLAKRLSAFTLNKETWLPFERSLKNTIMQQAAVRELQSITVPTTIIYGRLDFVVTRREVKKMFADNPHIELKVVTDMHGVSTRAARYLARLLTTKPARADLQ